MPNQTKTAVSAKQLIALLAIASVAKAGWDPVITGMLDEVKVGNGYQDTLWTGDNCFIEEGDNPVNKLTISARGNRNLAIGLPLGEYTDLPAKFDMKEQDGYTITDMINALCKSHVKNNKAPIGATGEISAQACHVFSDGSAACSDLKTTKITSSQYNTARPVSKSANKLRAHQGNHTLGR